MPQKHQAKKVIVNFVGPFLIFLSGVNVWLLKTTNSFNAF